MEPILEGLEELLEQRINDLMEQNKEKRDRLQRIKDLDRMDVIMNLLSGEDKEWLDHELMLLGCLKEEDGKTLYRAGFCDAIKTMKLLGI